VGTYAALDHTTWVSGYDLTGDTNGTSLDIEYDELDTTVFGNNARQRIAGLEQVESTVKGPWQSAASGAIDPTVFTGLGSTVEVVTQTPTGTEGDVAWLWQAKKFSYTIGGQIGEVFPYEMKMLSTKGSGTTSVGAVRGRLLVAPAEISGTGVAGSVVEAGAVASGEYLYCAVHCFTIGTSFTLQIQSDTASNFPSATTQMTTSSITATGGTWVTRVAGPITDTFWRVNVSAVSGTSEIAVAIGIK
jgi:hypothetical protein